MSAQLHGLARDVLAYILDMHLMVLRKYEAQWGEYRMQRMVLEKYEQLESLRG